MNIIVSLDGIIRSTVGGSVIREGRDLLAGLKSIANIVLLTDDKEDSAKRWLLQNKVTSYDFIVDSSVDLKDGSPLRQRQVNVVLSKTGKVLLFVDHEPENISWAMSQGITSMLFAHPVYALPKNRPGTKVFRKTWEDIEKAYDRSIGEGVEGVGV
jgi:hypothetical protein